MSNTGWTCPRCTRVYAPSVTECGACNGYVAAPIYPQWVPYVPQWVPYPSQRFCFVCGKYDCHEYHFTWGPTCGTSCGTSLTLSTTTGTDEALTRPWLGALEES